MNLADHQILEHLFSKPTDGHVCRKKHSSITVLSFADQGKQMSDFRFRLQQTCKRFSGETWPDAKGIAAQLELFLDINGDFL